MKRLLAVSLLVAAVAVPTAAAETLNVVTATALTPGADPITVTRQFYDHKLPREMYVVTSGPVAYVSTKVSCYSSEIAAFPKVSRASDTRPGRLSLGYEHGAYSCGVTATVTAARAKRGTIKIALQIVR